MKNTGKADLHIHTTSSDGFYSPDEILMLVKDSDISRIAVTDHDSVAALDTLSRRAAMYNISTVSGVELSAEYNGQDLHFLGYFINHHNKRFLDYLYLFRRRRFQRAQEMIDLLAKMGIRISMEQVSKEAKNGPIGRPHLADVIVKKGYARSRSEVFEKYLCNEGPAYVDKYRITAPEVINLIHSIGGAVFLAHPGAYCDDNTIKKLVSLGLDGVEVVHPKHSAESVKHYKALARKLSILTCGGSDFHGDPESSVSFGDFSIDDSEVDNIEKYCISKRSAWELAGDEELEDESLDDEEKEQEAE